MDEKISKLFLPLLEKLYAQDPAGGPFREPVNPVLYGCYDYYLYIKHPVDLSSIRDRLTDKQYKDAWQFVADVELMLNNAYLFNKKGTKVYEWTTKLSKIWLTELTPVMQRLNYCCGTLHKFGPRLLFCYGTTPDKYCQIAIGAKYKCYQDSYSFCMPCFNRIESEHINLQALSCETTRLNLSTEIVKKSDFDDVWNDHWQYEDFIECAQCSRRVHQICELWPVDEEVERCVQYPQIEEERRNQYRVLPRFEKFLDEAYVANLQTVAAEAATISTDLDFIRIKIEAAAELPTKDASSSSSSCTEITTTPSLTKSDPSEPYHSNFLDSIKQEVRPAEPEEQSTSKSESTGAGLDGRDTIASQTLDDELLHLARDVDDSHSVDWAPSSPSSIGLKNRTENAKDTNSHQNRIVQASLDDDQTNSTTKTSNPSSYSSCVAATPNSKQSVDKIAARLSINKLITDGHTDDDVVKSDKLRRDRFVCNHCYRRKRLGFDLRHRKFSARRLPHTRMSRYLEVKVNEYIRENSPTAGEMTIRVLTAYRDTVNVKPEMKEYLRRCREKNPDQHPNLEEYPDSFEFTTRAIFAWQEIDGVDVCVFGMHVQEYGEDCPEPNRQVVYLSYLDSVHFFRPKQFRTAVYHEILLSYFKYVKKLGFRRVFIWVCPSRKGDDYIFYRHPTEQKMPTLRRLSDWYISLLDKGVLAGIVERHHNIYDYATTENWNSVLSLPYLSGDYWPGEFERLLKLMIESQKVYEEKMLEIQQQKQQQDDQSEGKSLDMNQSSAINLNDMADLERKLKSTCAKFTDSLGDQQATMEQFNGPPLLGLQTSQTPDLKNGEFFNSKNALATSSLISSNGAFFASLNCGGDMAAGSVATGDFSRTLGMQHTPNSNQRLDDQPLDLSKSSANTSPESYYDDDLDFDPNYKGANQLRKKRRKSNAQSMSYPKKRSRTSYSQNKTRQSQLSLSCDFSKNFGKAAKAGRKSSTQANKDAPGSEILLDPAEELVKNLERSLKRQKEGFIVVRLNECNCSAHHEIQRRKEEVTFTCDMMKGREPFLQLARLKNYEFSTLRRAKFSSLAMVKHLGESFPLDPICNECFSFDSSKRHYVCQHCDDYYLCTSCHENTHHDHIMSLMAPTSIPDIDEFIPQCSLSSGANSISSASSTISNKSFYETPPLLEQSFELTSTKQDTADISMPPLYPQTTSNQIASSTTTTTSSMPLGCKRQRNSEASNRRTENEENAQIHTPFTSDSRLNLPKQPSPPPSHSSNSTSRNQVQVEFDQVLIESFIRHAEVTYNVDFDEMKSESKKLLTHYWSCPLRDTCCSCKFVVLSCSFMSVLMRSTRMQMMINCNPNVPEGAQNNGGTVSNSSHSGGGVNLTTSQRFGFPRKD